MICTNCGETMVGDGYTTVIHCPHVNWDRHIYIEPDAQPIHCVDADYPETET
jgi:hypothetical protein